MIKIDGNVIDINKYPNGESIIKTEFMTPSFVSRLLKRESILIELKFETNEDLINLYLIKKAIDNRLESMSNRDRKANVRLLMLYVPYCRMDKHIDGYASTLKMITSFINDLNFSEVGVKNPHSDMALYQLNNAVAISITHDIATIIKDICKQKGYEKMNLNDNLRILYPDEGANRRYNELSYDLQRDYNIQNHYKQEGGEIETIVAEKCRNLDPKAKSEITHYEIKGNQDLRGKNILIVDDICAGGYTFKLAAEALKKLGAEDIYLYVTHLENTVFKYGLLDNPIITKIYTTDSLITNKHDKIIIL